MSERLRYSPGEGIIYAATKARTLKNILLSSMVKALTNKTELINILIFFSEYLINKLCLAVLFQKNINWILSQFALQTIL